MTFGCCFSSFDLRPILLAALLLPIWAGVGCTRISQEAQQQPIQIELVEPLFPPAVGQDTLNIRLFTADDQPINDAALSIKADMTHAGMIPVLAETSGGDNGLYQAPVEWTMGGDWVVTIQAALPDGTVAEKSFALTISGDPADCEPKATKLP